MAGVSGRSHDRAQLAAEHLAERLGHAVEAHADLDAMLASGIDALVIAAPDEVHASALRAAGTARIPVLCEKPIVKAEDTAQLEGLLAPFHEHDVQLTEQCQWPFVLETFDELHPPTGTPAVHFEMRLSPANPGEAALRSSLSHFLSILQARTAVDASSNIEDLRLQGQGGVADGLEAAFVLRHGATGATAECRLELRVCLEQPRPAWFAIDGRRIDRLIDLDTYTISFVAGERTISVNDPTKALVYRFVESVRAPNIERTTAERIDIEHRARLYDCIVGAFIQHLGA